MAVFKEQMKRVCLIDSAIRTLHYPTKEMIRLHVCDGLSLPKDGICKSTIEKDMFYMKMSMDAPIKYSKIYGYFYSEEYNFIYAFLRYWSAYMILPYEIHSLIYDDS
jgi:hypothetical protein